MDNTEMGAPGDAAALAQRDAFIGALGIELVAQEVDRVVVRLRIRPQHLNFNGVVHGGVTFSLADAAFGYLVTARGRIAGAIDAHIMWSTPAREGDVLTATATEISRSRKLANGRVDVHRADGTLVCAFASTCYITDKPTQY